MILHITILNIARRRYCSIERDDDIEYTTILNIARRGYCSIERDALLLIEWLWWPRLGISNPSPTTYLTPLLTDIMMMMMMRMMVVMVVMTKMMIEYNTEAINQATWLDFMALSNQPKIGTIIMVLLSCQTHIYQDQIGVLRDTARAPQPPTNQPTGHQMSQMSNR